MDNHEQSNNCEQVICENTVYEFLDFSFNHGGYKHMGVVHRLFEAVARIRNMSKLFSKEFSEKEALDELIDAALIYRLFLSKDQEKL